MKHMSTVFEYTHRFNINLKKVVFVWISLSNMSTVFETNYQRYDVLEVCY